MKASSRSLQSVCFFLMEGALLTDAILKTTQGERVQRNEHAVLFDWFLHGSDEEAVNEVDVDTVIRRSWQL